MDYQESLQVLVSIYGSETKAAKAIGCSQTHFWSLVNEDTKMGAILALTAEKVSKRAVSAVVLCPRLKGLVPEYKLRKVKANEV